MSPSNPLPPQMNFFQAQDQARRNTIWLVLLFAAAVLSTIVIIHYITIGHILRTTSSFPGVTLRAPDSLAIITMGVIAVVAIGSLYKIFMLSGGGAKIAKSLGGQLISKNTEDPNERQLLNIVEEMAIAAGAPMPGVYLLPDDSINAFAAGTTPANAVIGVNRGAVQQLNREQMQGLMAHEFSHIMNGDMRINIRLTGFIHGIMLLGQIGRFTLISSGYTFRGAAKGFAQKDGFGLGFGLLMLGSMMFLVGIALVVAGFLGTIFGSLIRASISRQREYLADAVAVQYTRHPRGIAGALELIGQQAGEIKANEEKGKEKGDVGQEVRVAEYSHMFFSSTFTQGLFNPFATHPPLKDRISRVMTSWSEDALINTASAPSAVTDEKETPPAP